MTQIDNGIEDISCRILHVYHSNKRSRLVAATANKNEGKRKHSSSAIVAKMERKSRSTAETVMRRGLLQEQLSEMDSNINFTSSNLFDITVVPVDNKFSFIPIRGMQSHDEMMLNNDSFARADIAGNGLPSFDTGCYAMQLVQSNESAIDPPPPPLALFDGKVPSEYYPSYPPPPPTYKVGMMTKSADLFMRLKGMEEELLCEVRGPENTSEQLQKLELIQNWAKSIAVRPLQPRGGPTQYAQAASSAARTATDTFPAATMMGSPPESPKGQVTNKKESSGTPGTPSITP